MAGDARTARKPLLCRRWGKWRQRVTGTVPPAGMT